MKKLFLILFLSILSSSTATHSLSREKVSALIQTIIGGGTVGLTASLYQDTGNCLVVEGIKHLSAQAGFGSYVRQIRMHVQQLISKSHSGNPQDILEIEKIVYVVVGVIGAALILDGISSLLSDSKKE